MEPVRKLFLLAGLACVGVGFVGYFVPVLPSTVFMIVALFCFKRSSPRFEGWLLQHRLFGPTLRDWDASGAIKPRTKLVAITMMWACIVLSSFVVRGLWVALVLALGAVGTWYIASRPSAASPATPVPSPEA
ncbi:MAG: YbaN family protein [Fimbriimonadaceae bacterium]